MNRQPRLLVMIHPESVTRLLFGLLFAALLVIVDGYVLILVSRYVGIYLLLAAEATTGLIAVVSILSSYRHTVVKIHEAVHADRYPAAEFRKLACLWVGSICLVLPGFVTDAIGLAALIPPMRWGVGFLIEKAGKESFEEVYEYLRLDE